MNSDLLYIIYMLGKRGVTIIVMHKKILKLKIYNILIIYIL